MSNFYLRKMCSKIGVRFLAVYTFSKFPSVWTFAIEIHFKNLGKHLIIVNIMSGISAEYLETIKYYVVCYSSPKFLMELE